MVFVSGRFWLIIWFLNLDVSLQILEQAAIIIDN